MTQSSAFLNIVKKRIAELDAIEATNLTRTWSASRTG